MSNIQSENIGLVVVTFHPTTDDLAQIEKMSARYSLIAVDNTTENRGIAVAQNLAIRQLQNNPLIEYVVFLDQDSRVSEDFPLQMAQTFESVVASGLRLAALGPQVCYAETGAPYKSVFHADKAPQCGCVVRREIISSGSCVPMAVLNDVGLMDETLFIDYVDFEWCWRAEQKGYVCGIAPHISMLHKVGLKELHLGRYRVIVSAAYRYYYQYRNHRLLSARTYVPRQWKYATGIKHAARLIYLPLVVADGKAIRQAMHKGLHDSRKR